MTEPTESNRERVRRILLGPLGFRSPKGTAPEAERMLLDGVADDLAYLTDGDLLVLLRMLAVHGEGAAKCFWPPKATFVGLAHHVRPRPLSQDPALLRWWASVEGQRMVQDGTLVETYGYFERHRVPPVKPGARAQLLEAAQANARRLALVEERERLDLPVRPEEADWARWYRARRDELAGLVERSKQGKGQAA